MAQDDRTQVIRRDQERPVAARTGSDLPWYRTGKPMTVLGWALGIFFLVLGAVAMARAGIDATDWTEPVVEVGPFDRTALMGVIEVIWGLALLSAGVSDRDPRTVLFLGGLSIVFGLIWIIEPTAFGGALGLGSGTGWLYLTIGAVLTAAGAAAPRERVIRV